MSVAAPAPPRSGARERRNAGRAAREAAPRSSHRGWERDEGAVDPVAILAAQAQTRDPDLVPIRHARMLESPFAFFRGAAAVMAADLAGTPDSGIRAQLCGDAHLDNFGGFASPDRTLVFDINDFDETNPGPWEWDLKRLLASLEIAGRDRGDEPEARRRIVLASAREYRGAMRRFVKMSGLELFADRVDAGSLLEKWGRSAPKRERARARRNLAKGRSKDHLRALSKLTERVDGRLRIRSQPPVLSPLEEWLPADRTEHAEAWIEDLIGRYASTLRGAPAELLSRYRYVHLARKVVGVGSVGTRALIVLLEGDGEDDPLFLQVKEAQPSVLEPYTGRSRYRRHGRRVVEGQWLMQAAGDIFLGWLTAEGVDGVVRDFYVRQLWDWKTSADVAGMSTSSLESYGRACAWTLARAHARTGDRFAIAGYAGKGDALDKAMASFARAYADRNEMDHAAFAAAVEAGRLPAERGA